MEVSVPPQAIELEEAVLGGILLESEGLMQVADFLTPEMFYKSTNSVTFSAILSLSIKNEPIDSLTVVQELKKKGKLKAAGGVLAVTQLTSSVASSQNIEYHARIVVQKSIQRNLIRAATHVINDAYNDVDCFDLIDSLERELTTITRPLTIGKSETMLDLWRQVNEKNTILLEKKGISGVPSGYFAIDRITGGWQAPDLIIIASRPAMGKTSLIANFARNAAVDHKQAGAIFSLEMSALQIATRIFSLESNVGLSAFLRHGISPEQMLHVEKDCKKLIDTEIYIDDTPSLSIRNLRTKARKLKREKDIKWLAVDYLQLMTVDTDFKGNREQEISTISRQLKALAKELNIPVLALSQLSRAVESRGGDKRPQLSDLRDSGAIEQDADIVIFIHRPEYYGISQYENGESTEGQAEIIFAKHRNGSTGSVILGFIKELTKFEPLDTLIPSRPLGDEETPY